MEKVKKKSFLPNILLVLNYPFSLNIVTINWLSLEHTNI